MSLDIKAILIINVNRTALHLLPNIFIMYGEVFTSCLSCPVDTRCFFFKSISSTLLVKLSYSNSHCLYSF